jgi:hypothetical protein
MSSVNKRQLFEFRLDRTIHVRRGVRQTSGALTVGPIWSVVTSAEIQGARTV